MALLQIKVSGSFQDMPTPSELMVSIMDLSDAYRMANGSLKIDRIATKRKMEISYKFLSRSNLQTLLNAVGQLTFSVKYMDPVTNIIETKTFYSGDRSIGMLDYISDVPRYKDVKFNLIET